MASTETATHALLNDGEDVAAAHEADTVWIDEHRAIGSEKPHGGVKGSGFGEDMSMHALEEYTAVSPVPADEVGRVTR